jgi:hypothetical protein
MARRLIQRTEGRGEDTMILVIQGVSEWTDISNYNKTQLSLPFAEGVVGWIIVTYVVGFSWRLVFIMGGAKPVSSRHYRGVGYQAINIANIFVSTHNSSSPYMKCQVWHNARHRGSDVMIHRQSGATPEPAERLLISAFAIHHLGEHTVGIGLYPTGLYSRGQSFKTGLEHASMTSCSERLNLPNTRTPSYMLDLNEQ